MPPLTRVVDDRAQVRRLADRLLPRTAALADALVGRIAERERAYADLDVVAREDLRRSCLRNLERIVQSLGGRVPPGADPFDAPAETGRRRAAQGMPLEAVLHSYRLGGRLIWDALVELARDDPDDPDRDGLLRAAGLVWEEIDRFSSALAEAYRAEEVRRRTQHRHQQQTDLTALLDGALDDAARVRVGERLAVPEGSAYVGLAVLLDDPGVPPFSVADALAARGVHAVWAVRAGVETGLARLDRPDRAGLLALLAPVARQRVGVSPAASALAQVPTASRLADAAARSLPRPGVAPLEDRLPHALLASAPELARLLLSRTVEPVLAGPDGPALLDTVAALLAASGSYSRAAAATFCHRNTVIARVQRVAERCGADPTTPDGGLLWSLALLAREQGA